MVLTAWGRHWLSGHQHSLPRNYLPERCWLPGSQCTLAGGTCLRGNSTIFMRVSADCLGGNCLFVDSSISLRDSPSCLGTACLGERSASCMDSAVCPGTAILRGRGTGHLRTSTLCPGVACLYGGNSTKQTYISLFLIGNLLNLLTRLSLILWNLSSLILSVNCWHLSIIYPM